MRFLDPEHCVRNHRAREATSPGTSSQYPAPGASAFSSQRESRSMSLPSMSTFQPSQPPLETRIKPALGNRASTMNFGSDGSIETVGPS